MERLSSKSHHRSYGTQDHFLTVQKYVTKHNHSSGMPVRYSNQCICYLRKPGRSSGIHIIFFHTKSDLQQNNRF